VKQAAPGCPDKTAVDCGVKHVSEWCTAIRAHSHRTSLFGLFWLLMFAATACVLFAPGLAGASGGIARAAATVLVAGAAGLTAASMRLDGALAGGITGAAHVLLLSLGQAGYQALCPQAVVRGDYWTRRPVWTHALAEAMVVLILTFIIGAVVGYLAALLLPKRARG